MEETGNKKEYINKNILVYENGELNSQMRTILNDDGSISINAEDVAIGLGWTQEKNGKIYVKWERINGYCKEFGFSPLVGKDYYIPESLFYMLAMKANNERAQKFQRWIAMDVVPAIRKTGTYSMAKEKVLQQFMEQQTEFNQKMMERLEHLEDPGKSRNRGSYKGNPFLTASANDIEERKEEIYVLTARLAELWGCQHTQILHQMYKMLEIKLEIVLDCYKSVYRSETGRQYASMAEVIASHDWLYENAVHLCERTIKKVQNMN